MTLNRSLSASQFTFASYKTNHKGVSFFISPKPVNDKTMKIHGRRRKAWMVAGMICLGSFAWKESRPGSGKKTITSTEAKIDSSSAGVGEGLFELLSLGEKGLQKRVFLLALAGYQKLSSGGMLKKPLLAIVDFSQPSGKKRLYILNLTIGELLVHTLVAHGRNSGDRMATHFSNIPSSLQSSLGFYVAGDTYTGNNGLSMRLTGLERGFNDKAENRAIVMHGASYVNETLAAGGRIGRSWGCPAVSQKEHRHIIDLLKNGSCLFIYAPNQQYLAQSTLVKNQDIGSKIN
jgi:L,D-transpeptidase catalytic domain